MKIKNSMSHEILPGICKKYFYQKTKLKCKRRSKKKFGLAMLSVLTASSSKCVLTIKIVSSNEQNDSSQKVVLKSLFIKNFICFRFTNC